mgnify:CR=1 FL=1|tara:strand:+ start:38311 stop:38685 length:375 start_codon:yes stop_codon:yes gene_type:complete
MLKKQVIILLSTLFFTVTLNAQKNYKKISANLDGKLHNTNKATIWRWRQAYQNDFVARIDCTIKTYEDANHPPVAGLSRPNKITAKAAKKLYWMPKVRKTPMVTNPCMNGFITAKWGLLKATAQ